MDLHITEKIENDYMKKHGLNFAETILRAANEDLGLGLDKNALLLAAGFGGGMAVGSVCGALTGAVMVLSRLYVKDRAHESTRIKEIEKKFIESFEKKFGTLLCGPIKDKYFKPDVHCKSVVLAAAGILEDLLKSDPPAYEIPVNTRQ
jgi:C_GCAxxG_C_C family probable redox protein